MIPAIRIVAGTVTLSTLTACASDAPWLSGVDGVALLLVAAAAMAAGWALATLRQRDVLQQARQQARLCLSLAPGLSWQTNAQCHLLPGPLGAGGHPLWDLFDAGADADRLREAMLQQDRIEPLVVSRIGEQTLWQLRAEPRFDGAGAFAGHQGLALPLDVGGPALAAIEALVDGASGATLVALRGPGAEGWRVLRANAPAQEHFGTATALDDGRIRAALPAALQRAFDQRDASAEADGWQLRFPAQTTQPLLVLWQTGIDPAAAEQASFSYTVSHDLRAPIRVVEGFTRIVKEDYGPRLDRVANDHLDRVMGAAARMNQMIDAMLALARLSSQPIARQPVNLSQLAAYVIEDLRRGASERQADIEIEPGLLAQGDPTLLRLVLENLLGNAWKYTQRRAQTRIHFGSDMADGRTAYVVRDNGAGFDMRSSDRLFGLFQRLHSASDFAGTGVGLASVRRIVQRHGGEIWAEGEPDRGAAFYFTLRH